MDTDIFGNLREWNDVPRQVAELIQRGELDEHQAGLVRILRYRHNWKLRELVLNAVKNLKVPTTGLIPERVRTVKWVLPDFSSSSVPVEDIRSTPKPGASF